MNGKVAKSVKELVMPILDELSYELVDVEYKKEGKRWALRIFIDKEGGINTNDCSLVSKKISCLLDVEDPIPQSYSLEVSSPGVERPLRTREHYKRFEGNPVKIRCFSPVKGRKTVRGRIKGVEKEQVVIEEKESKELIEIPFDMISKANLVFEFP